MVEVTKPIKIAAFGLGSIGLDVVKYAASKRWADIVGGVDIDPRKAGKPLVDITGIASINEARVYKSFDELWETTQPEVVIHTTVSRVETALEQIIPMVERGITVISSCEELLYPYLRAGRLAEMMNARCQQTHARVLATGVNPGFLLDVFPIFMTGVCVNVRRVYVKRVVNASTRRKPLQEKIGVGLEPEAFRARFKAGKLGHAGLRESLCLIAHTFGWEINNDKISETCEPVILEKPTKTEFFEVLPGETCGLHQTVWGEQNGLVKVTLDLQIYLDAPSPHDLVHIDGTPPIEAVIKGGVPGDVATAATLVNAVPRVLNAPPGLLLMTDVSLPRWCGE